MTIDVSAVDLDEGQTVGAPSGPVRKAAICAAVLLGFFAVLVGVRLGTQATSYPDLGTVSQNIVVAPADIPAASANSDVLRLPPVRLAIPALGVDAPIDAVNTSADGILEPPADVSRLGWWAPGARPMGPGSTVVTGHVDSKDQGHGALYELRSIPLGSVIDVATADGNVRYVASSRVEYDKGALPEELFSVSSDRRLVLITCGGAFDSSTGNYEHNIVVTAVPV